MSSSQVAIVTGGARGIGRAISIALAKRGVHVVVNYKNSHEAAAALVEEIARAGGSASMIRADVAELAEVRAMVREVRRAHGRLDVLVNNAGVLLEGLFSLVDLEAFWGVLRTNLGGVANCCKCASPLLGKGRSGRIVNIASIAGMHATLGLSAYATSKAAVITLSGVLARELAPQGISVNVVAPGLVDTDMPASMKKAEARERSIASQPVARIGTPEEVAAVVAFLSLDAPSYLTGEVIRVDGGALIG